MKIQLVISISLLYSSPAIYARSVYHSDLSHDILRPRQDDDTGDNYCAPACLIPSCSNTACNGRGDTSKRSLMAVKNASAPNDLEKRVFKIDPSSNTPQLDVSQYTLDQISNYIVSQWDDDTYDNQYGRILDFQGVDETDDQTDERAVSHSAAFGSNGFQFFSAGLHGCTQVVVVSNRGVWMAHFWEAYSNGYPVAEALNSPASTQQFTERVLNFLSGTSVNPGTANPGYFVEPYGRQQTKIHPYIPPSGDPLQPDLFNQDGDNTQVFIMAPAAPNTASTVPDKNRKFMAPSRIESIITTIRRRLGIRGLQVVRYPYIRLLPDVNGDIPEQNLSQRGFAVFQFDPNSDGAGRRTWRLFLEGAPYSSDVP